MSLKIISFNILAPCWADPQIYPKTEYLDKIYRRNKIINFLLQTDADIIGLQEVTETEFGFIKNALSLYQGFQSFHSDTHWQDYITIDPPYEKNGNALFLKKSVFKSMIFSAVRLSDNGNFCVSCIANHIKTNKDMKILSVHLDSDSANLRKIQMNSALNLNPDIICGDFNIDVNKSNLQQDILKAGFVPGLIGGQVTSPYLGKYYANSVYGPIDNIIVKELFVINDSKIYDFGIFQTYPNKKNEDKRIIEGLKECGSDHFPVSVNVLL